ncbi:hypothetical protein D7Y13_28655 [Corallococcus praedator]|uniref:Uncharacterized protein n=1 Tax=Corallococcus praedator TaxID=2316724 RepID=A0ABX9QAK3_9BACT|nr:hypothetical protein D7X75_32990 [Corallococcus sp. CA031C]RKH98468.1 hypothetical protein D7Y13_28655 [Corallococcus praedator]
MTPGRPWRQGRLSRTGRPERAGAGAATPCWRTPGPGRRACRPAPGPGHPRPAGRRPGPR